MIFKKLSISTLFFFVILPARNPFEYECKIKQITFVSSGFINNQPIAVIKIFDEIKTVQLGFVVDDYELIQINQKDIIFKNKKKPFNLNKLKG